MLTTEEIENLKIKLVKAADELRTAIQELEKMPEFGSDTDHFEEETNEAEEFSKNMGEMKLFKERLGNIEHALTKIEAGTYGTCESCKKEIGADLLAIAPESRLCRDCKLQQA